MADNPKGVFINIGSGFTSYQYLLPKGFKTIEIDLPSIIAFRRQRAEILVQLGKLPFRHTEYFSLDLAKKDSRLTLYELLARTTEIPSFILMEGLTYYLPDSVVDNLCFLFCSRQRPGSILAFDYWLNTIRGSSVFNRLCSFYLREFNFARRRFNLFTARRIEQLYGYETIAQSDVYHQEPLFSAKPILTRSPLTLPENYAVLRRTHSSQLSR